MGDYLELIFIRIIDIKKKLFYTKLCSLVIPCIYAHYHIQILFIPLYCLNWFKLSLISFRLSNSYSRFSMSLSICSCVLFAVFFIVYHFHFLFFKGGHIFKRGGKVTACLTYNNMTAQQDDEN